ncbi:MAG: peptide deformylase [Lentisphaerae bacterium]|nr:peptide deformylase [Lentisphaerota bacterium]
MIFQKNGKSYTVCTVGAPVLREIAAPVAVIDDSVRQLASEMIGAMHYFNGIGLAAPQYGKSLRLVVIDVPGGNESGSPGEAMLLPRMPLTLINPEIVFASGDCDEKDEGCLSVPGLYAPVCRPSRVVLRSQLLDGEFIEIECGGLLGRCIQHELDHLDGKLFIDRLSPKNAREVRGDVDRLTRIGQTKNFRRNK